MRSGSAMGTPHMGAFLQWMTLAMHSCSLHCNFLKLPRGASGEGAEDAIQVEEGPVEKL